MLVPFQPGRQEADQFLQRFLHGGIETLEHWKLELKTLWPFIDWHEISNAVLFAVTARQFGLEELYPAASYFVYWGRLKTVCDLAAEDADLGASYLTYYGLSAAEVAAFSKLQLSFTTPLAS